MKAPEYVISKAPEYVISLEETIEQTMAVETDRVHAELVHAKVFQWSGTQGMVRVGTKTIQAQSAFSCLVVPQPEDDVLLCIAETEAHVLALLDRPGGSQKVQVTVPGAEQVVLQATNLQLSGSEQINIDAPKGNFKIGQLAVMANKILQVATQLMTRAEDLISISTRTTETCENRVSSVSGIDMRKANQVNEEVKGTLIMRTGVYLANIKEDVRMVAKRIMFS